MLPLSPAVSMEVSDVPSCLSTSVIELTIDVIELWMLETWALTLVYVDEKLLAWLLESVIKVWIVSINLYKPPTREDELV